MNDTNNLKKRFWPFWFERMCLPRQIIYISTSSWDLLDGIKKEILSDSETFPS